MNYTTKKRLPIDDIGNIQQNVYGTNGNTIIGKSNVASQKDFTVEYTSKKTITLSNYPDGISGITDQDIVSVHVLNANKELKKIYTRIYDTFSITGDVLTISSGDFAEDDEFIIYTNIIKGVSVSFDNEKNGLRIQPYFDSNATYNIEYYCYASPSAKLNDEVRQISRLRKVIATGKLHDITYAISGGVGTSAFIFKATDLAYVSSLSYNSL